MVSVVELLLLPFRALWLLVKLLVAPVAVVAGAYLVLGGRSPWFVGVVLVGVLFSVLVVWLWVVQMRGVLHSLARGTSTVRLTGRRVGAPGVQGARLGWGGGRR